MTTDKPLLLMAAGLGLRDAVLGVGFFFSIDEVQKLQLYQNFNELVPHFSGEFAGVLLCLFGLFVFITSLMNRPGLAKYGLRFQALAWLFSTLMYFIAGQVLLGLAIGLFFSFAAGYLAFYFQYAPQWKQERQKIDKAIQEHRIEDKDPPRRV